jgi:hypothetical protein
MCYTEVGIDFTVYSTFAPMTSLPCMFACLAWLVTLMLYSHVLCTNMFLFDIELNHKSIL